MSGHVLTEFPSEVLRLIFLHLSVEDLVRSVCRTCRLFRDHVQSLLNDKDIAANLCELHQHVAVLAAILPITIDVTKMSDKQVAWLKMHRGTIALEEPILIKKPYLPFTFSCSINIRCGIPERRTRSHSFDSATAPFSDFLLMCSTASHEVQSQTTISRQWLKLLDLNADLSLSSTETVGRVTFECEVLPIQMLLGLSDLMVTTQDGDLAMRICLEYLRAASQDITALYTLASPSQNESDPALWASLQGGQLAIDDIDPITRSQQTVMMSQRRLRDALNKPIRILKDKSHWNKPASRHR